MNVYVKPTDADIVSCPYIKGEKFRQRYAILNDLTPYDFDMLIINGWRHFGYYFFMPNCETCNSCMPIRTMISDFTPTKSQRRNLKKNNSIVEVEFVEPQYSDEIYSVYEKHSKVKFEQESTVKDFKESFFADAIRGNSKLSLFRVDGILVGIGFLDMSEQGISSVYFCYDTDYSHLGLGVYSVLKEIEFGKLHGKSYYYLGYYVEGNGSMEYKSRYTPSEILDWNKAEWVSFKSGCTV